MGEGRGDAEGTLDEQVDEEGGPATDPKGQAEPLAAKHNTKHNGSQMCTLISLLTNLSHTFKKSQPS